MGDTHIQWRGCVHVLCIPPHKTGIQSGRLVVGITRGSGWDTVKQSRCIYNDRRWLQSIIHRRLCWSNWSRTCGEKADTWAEHTWPNLHLESQLWTHQSCKINHPQWSYVCHCICGGCHPELRKNVAEMHIQKTNTGNEGAVSTRRWLHFNNRPTDNELPRWIWCLLWIFAA